MSDMHHYHWERPPLNAMTAFVAANRCSTHDDLIAFLQQISGAPADEAQRAYESALTYGYLREAPDGRVLQATRDYHPEG